MLTATGPSPASVLATSPPPSSSTRVSPSAPARAVPVSTTAPVKSATNPDAGAAARSLGVPCWTIRPASITPTRSPSCAASAKSWVTSSAGTSTSRSTPRRARGRGRAGAGVEGGQRLVQQQRARAPCQRARHGHALALATGEGGRPGVRARRQAEAVEQRERPLPALGARDAAQRIGHVLPGAQVREEGVLLEHVAAAAPLGRHVDPAARVEPGLLAARDAAALRAEQPRRHSQHAGLAGARRPGQRQALARADLHRHVQLEVAEDGSGLNAQHRRAPPRP